jgi:Mg-chelatase subunit ChlD
MIKCKQGHENPDSAKFCLECQEPLQGQQAPTQTADIVFCFDATGSMTDEIDDLKKSAIEFSNALNSAGVQFKVGLVQFRDLKVGEPLEVLVPLTESAIDFHNGVQSLTAAGGGDEPESAFDAIRKAVQLDGWRGGGVRRYVVLVTDASANEPDADGKGVSDLINELAQAEVRVMLVVPQGMPQYEQIAKALGSRAKLLPIVEGDKRQDFARILDRIVQGTAVADMAKA